LSKRSRKQEFSLETWQKILIVVLILATVTYIKMSFFPSKPYIPEVQERSTEEVIDENNTENEKPKTYAYVFFIGQNENKEEVYRAVKREWNEEKEKCSLLSFAITQLIKGPTDYEKSKNVYSEIPKNTKFLGISENSDKAIINLSTEFAMGGGTDSIYKRLYQLIKTANKNSKTDVYLNINGKQAETIGGEGIMINQPLNERTVED
jgi:spore germination protein GerM